VSEPFDLSVQLSYDFGEAQLCQIAMQKLADGPNNKVTSVTDSHLGIA